MELAVKLRPASQISLDINIYKKNLGVESRQTATNTSSHHYCLLLPAKPIRKDGGLASSKCGWRADKKKASTPWKLPMSSEARSRASTCGQSRGTIAACPPCVAIFCRAFIIRSAFRERRLLCCSSWILPASGACWLAWMTPMMGSDEESGRGRRCPSKPIQYRRRVSVMVLWMDGCAACNRTVQGIIIVDVSSRLLI